MIYGFSKYGENCIRLMKVYEKLRISNISKVVNFNILRFQRKKVTKFMWNNKTSQKKYDIFVLKIQTFLEIHDSLEPSR